MSERKTMLVWTLRTWPKAQYLARALEIPSDAWEIPYLFVPLGGPEVSVFEAMEKPELGMLTGRLRALTKPLAAAAYTDPWVKATLIGDSKLAVAFHPGVSAELVQEMSTRDGYRVVDMATAMSERTASSKQQTAGAEQPAEETLAREGLLDQHAEMRARWKAEGVDHDAMVARTLALPVWQTRHHSAAFYLASRLRDWPQSRELPWSSDAREALQALVRTDIAHPLVTEQLQSLSGT